MLRFSKIFTSKLFIFTVQISILSLLIYLFKYKFYIVFDVGITEERKIIIQTIANYIMFNQDKFSDGYFSFTSWSLISLIPVFIFRDYKKVYSMNLTAFFFPNFFFYVFLYRYSPVYFESNFLVLIMRTIALGIFIILFSLGLTYTIKKITKSFSKMLLEDLKLTFEEATSKCPYCGKSFKSKPIYCYNCLKELNVEYNDKKNK